MSIKRCVVARLVLYNRRGHCCMQMEGSLRVPGCAARCCNLCMIKLCVALTLRVMAVVRYESSTALRMRNCSCGCRACSCWCDPPCKHKLKQTAASLVLAGCLSRVLTPTSLFPRMQCLRANLCRGTTQSSDVR